MDIRFNQDTFDISLVGDSDNFFDIVVTRNPSEDLMQRLFTRLKTYPRDLFWNTKYGIDYLNSVFGKNRPISSVDIIIKNEINKEPLVDSIEYFESEIFNYSYACKFTVVLKDTTKELTYFILTNEDGVILTNESGDRLTSRI